MILRPPSYTRTDTLFPSTTLFRYVGERTCDAANAPRNAHDFHRRPRQFGSRCRLWKIPLRDASSQDGIVAPTVDGFGISRTYGAYGGATVYCRFAVGEEPRSAGVSRSGERGWGDRHRRSGKGAVGKGCVRTVRLRW